MSGAEVAQARLRQLQIVVAALILGVLTFMVVVVGLVASGALEQEPNPTFQLLLYLAIGYLAISLTMAPMLYSKLCEAGNGATEEAVAYKWFTATVVSMAIREGAGLFGIVAALLMVSPFWALVFGIMTAAAMGLAWPRGHDLEERLRKVRRTD